MTIFNLFSVNSLLFAVLVRLQLLHSLALVITYVAGESDIEPGFVGIDVVVFPITRDATFQQ